MWCCVNPGFFRVFWQRCPLRVAEFLCLRKVSLYRSLGQRPRCYTQVGLAEGLVSTVAWGKRSAALGLVDESSRLAEGHVHVS